MTIPSNIQNLSEVQTNSTPSDVTPPKTQPSSSDIIIRPATSSDAVGIAAIGYSVFKTTFAHTCSEKDMDDYLAVNFTSSVIAAELSDPQKSFHVASIDDRIVGFATLTLGADEPCVESYESRIELQRLYVDNSLHGRGVARLLMDASLDKARQDGYEVIWLGVWEYNERAYRFYQKFGFEKVGEHVFMLGTDRQIDWILLRKL